MKERKIWGSLLTVTRPVSSSVSITGWHNTRRSGQWKRCSLSVTFIFCTIHHEQWKDSRKSNISVGKPSTSLDNSNSNGFFSSLTFCIWIISDDIVVFRRLSSVSSISVLFSSDDIGYLRCKLFQNVAGGDRTYTPRFWRPTLFQWATSASSIRSNFLYI